MRTFSLLILLFATAGCAPRSRPKLPAPVESRQACLERVNASFATRAAQEASANDRKFQVELARCVAPNASIAQVRCAGVVNRDHRYLARQLQRNAISPALYLQRVRDRTHKLERCTDDPAWSEHATIADADEDLVADVDDQCADTPRLSATDARGCPLPDPPAADGPSPELVRRALEVPVMVPNRRCMRAPVPTVPFVAEAVSVDWPSGSHPRLRSRIGESIGQPADCPVVYQVAIEEVIPLRLPDPALPTRRPERLRLVLDPRKAIGQTVGPPALVFETEHPRMSFFFHQGARVKFRAVNGAGLFSSWSSSVSVGRR